VSADDGLDDKTIEHCKAQFNNHLDFFRGTPTMPPAPTTYTIASIDEAMRQIAGERAVRPGDYGWNRVTTMLSVASRAWIDERPEDEHSRILRAALRDLNTKGCLTPSDGVWPEH
jgi:hypothetical protein